MDLRVVEIDGAPWFVLADVCKNVGSYIRTDGSINAGAAVRHLGTDERRKLSYKEAKDIGLQSSASRAHGILMLSESGLYKMVLRSRRRAEAIKFQDYVTREVLPSIRKTGSYTMPGARN